MSRRREILGALAACLILASTASASAASLHRSPAQSVQLAAPAHLYVAVIGAKAGKVIRYPFINGLPAKKPDFVYRGITSPIAVDTHGTLYGQSHACCFCVAHIDTWPAGATKPTGHVEGSMGEFGRRRRFGRRGREQWLPVRRLLPVSLRLAWRARA